MKSKTLDRCCGEETRGEFVPYETSMKKRMEMG